MIPKHKQASVSLSKMLDELSSSDQCILWERAKSSGGYGNVFFMGKVRRANRVAWEMKFGPIPEGLCVLHKCDVPACVNPKHLFLGTQLDNIRDRDQKGRHGSQRHPKSPYCKNGHIREEGRRTCRICANESQRKYREAHRG